MHAETLPPEAGKPFTVLAVAGMIDVIAQYDGLVGLASGESLLSSTGLAVLHVGSFQEGQWVFVGPNSEAGLAVTVIAFAAIWSLVTPRSVGKAFHSYVTRPTTPTRQVEQLGARRVAMSMHACQFDEGRSEELCSTPDVGGKRSTESTRD